MPPQPPPIRLLRGTRQLQAPTTLAALLLPQARRGFTTTAPAPYRQPPLRPAEAGLPIPSPTAHDAAIPPYPPGARRVYKQSNTGLYGLSRLRFGNNVTGRHDTKTPRKWRPNIHQRRLWSEALGSHVRTRVSTRVLRTIDKVGGLDNYLLGDKSRRILELGPWGWKLRWRIMQTDAVRARFRAQREALGLPVDDAGDALSEMPAGLEDGATEEALLAETQRMLDQDEEFDLEGAAEPAGFMREERPAKEM